MKGLRATTKAEAEQAWQEAMNTPGPVLIDFVVSKEENVYPMVPQGAAIDQMLMGDE
ncbi:Acetolactate synthase isozyme 1 large subunit [compost metagenome]